MLTTSAPRVPQTLTTEAWPTGRAEDDDKSIASNITAADAPAAAVDAAAGGEGSKGKTKAFAVGVRLGVSFAVLVVLALLIAFALRLQKDKARAAREHQVVLELQSSDQILGAYWELQTHHFVFFWNSARVS